MAAFELVSDKQFIMASDTKDDHDIWAFEYPGDPTRWDIIRPGHNWGVGVRVGNSEHAQFKSLKVLGVAIKGTQLTELARDLILDSKVDNQNFRLLVNRLGHCLLRKVNNPTIVMLRINDYFGWSKYGVTLPAATPTNVLNKHDMYNWDTVVDTRATMVAGEQANGEAKELRIKLAEKEKKVESLNLELEVCKKELECTKEIATKSKQIESLLSKSVGDKEKEFERANLEIAVCKKELECMKEMVTRGEEIESVLRKSVGDKEKELERMSHRLTALNGVLKGLVGDDEHAEELMKRIV
ncbi:hypothetical protein LINGRAPRIM_LOCUS1307 [Linum grandiflorum]